MLYRIKEIKNNHTIGYTEFTDPKTMKKRVEEILSRGNLYRLYSKPTREDKWKRMSNPTVRRILHQM